jgi:hypothetical protein
MHQQRCEHLGRLLVFNETPWECRKIEVIELWLMLKGKRGCPFSESYLLDFIDAKNIAKMPK